MYKDYKPNFISTNAPILVSWWVNAIKMSLFFTVDILLDGMGFLIECEDVELRASNAFLLAFIVQLCLDLAKLL